MSQRRSAPTSCGASTRSGTSLMPGSTVNGLPPKYVSTMASSVCCTVGTTLEMATPRISCWVMPRVARMHPAAYAPRALEPGRPGRAQASLDEARVAILERVQQGRQYPRHLVRPLGGEPERGRPLPQLTGKHELVDVDADAQDHVGE